MDFPVNLLLFFIIGISINLPENGYEVGKASWPPWRDLLLQALHPRLEWKRFLSAGIQSGLVSVSLGRGITLILTLTEVLCFLP